VGFRLDDKNAPEPDIAFVAKERAQSKGGYFEGAPDLALEIVTPDSKQRDYELKRQLYERFGVQEYWIIDERKAQITVYALSKQKKYRERRPKMGILASQIIPGFWLNPEWLWHRPLPNPLETLQEITAGTDKT
jgi:Uma2 family endonuclease